MSSVSGSVAGLENAHLLRRASSMRRAFTTGGQAAIKRNSVALQVKFQVDGLVEQLRRTRAHFVHCFLPQHAAGLCDVKMANGGSKPEDTSAVNVPLLRSQVSVSSATYFLSTAGLLIIDTQTWHCVIVRRMSIIP